MEQGIYVFIGNDRDRLNELLGRLENETSITWSNRGKPTSFSADVGVYGIYYGGSGFDKYIGFSPAREIGFKEVSFDEFVDIMVERHPKIDNVVYGHLYKGKLSDQDDYRLFIGRENFDIMDMNDNLYSNSDFSFLEDITSREQLELLENS
jgi:hypothetical protein